MYCIPAFKTKGLWVEVVDSLYWFLFYPPCSLPFQELLKLRAMLGNVQFFGWQQKHPSQCCRHSDSISQVCLLCTGSGSGFQLANANYEQTLVFTLSEVHLGKVPELWESPVLSGYHTISSEPLATNNNEIWLIPAAACCKCSEFKHIFGCSCSPLFLGKRTYFCSLAFKKWSNVDKEADKMIIWLDLN